jgi:hypothetical protein
MVAALTGTASHQMRQLPKSLTRRSTVAESPSVHRLRIRTHNLVMNRKKAIWIGLAALAVVFALFDVRFNFEFSLPATSNQPDIAQEARFDACYAERDKEIHDEAFGTIDNPDVQKLFIINNRKQAVTECRLQFPEQLTAIEKPFRFNILDLQFRY